MGGGSYKQWGKQHSNICFKVTLFNLAILMEARHSKLVYILEGHFWTPLHSSCLLLYQHPVFTICSKANQSVESISRIWRKPSWLTPASETQELLNERSTYFIYLFMWFIDHPNLSCLLSSLSTINNIHKYNLFSGLLINKFIYIQWSLNNHI